MHLCSITSNLEKAAKDWRAGCAERCTSGSGRGGEKRTGLETSRNVSWQVKSMKQHRAGRLLYAGTRTHERTYETSLLEMGRRESSLRSKDKASRECCQARGTKVRIIHYREGQYPLSWFLLRKQVLNLEIQVARRNKEERKNW